jgi:lipoyl(octanoyl) transferase
MNSVNKNTQAYWRLIINSVNGGAWNMAVDEAVLESVANKNQAPTLRLYAWNPYCLSLGHAQSINDVNRIALQERGIDLVRRPTGGKAILHADEITYSIAAPQDEPRVSGTVIESYQRLSQALLKALTLLGIHADAKAKEASNTSKPVNPICFETPSDFEITANGKKIIGSAQARRLKGVLQHGSIPLFGDISRIVNLLNYPSQEERQLTIEMLLKRACTLFDINNQKINWNTAAFALINGFSEVLDISFVKDSISPLEMERAKELVKNKYGNDDWTLRI